MCGTDRHIAEGTFYRSAYPAILGHETLGRVVQLGAAVRHLAEGDLILRTTAVRPGDQLGEWNSMLGGFAALALATDVRALTEDGRDDLIKPYDRLGSAPCPRASTRSMRARSSSSRRPWSWLRSVGDVRDRRVVIIGTGGAALMFIQIARSAGAKQVIVVGRREERLARARELGAHETITSGPTRSPRSCVS